MQSRHRLTTADGVVPTLQRKLQQLEDDLYTTAGAVSASGTALDRMPKVDALNEELNVFFDVAVEGVQNYYPVLYDSGGDPFEGEEFNERKYFTGDSVTSRHEFTDASVEGGPLLSHGLLGVQLPQASNISDAFPTKHFIELSDGQRIEVLTDAEAEVNGPLDILATRPRYVMTENSSVVNGVKYAEFELIRPDHTVQSIEPPPYTVRHVYPSE